MIKPVQLLSGFAVMLISMNVAAAEYVPPPTGPYQSSIVIDSQNNDRQQQPIQVYRFPPADLFSGSDQAKHSMPLMQQQPAFNADVFNQSGQIPIPMDPARQEIMDMNAQYAEPLQDSASLQQQPQAPQSPFYPQLTENPWAVGAQTYQQPYTSPWAAQNYNYPMPYQNMNHNQNYNSNPYNMNEPFSGMPQPWQMMPMQPFFSGQ